VRQIRAGYPAPHPTTSSNRVIPSARIRSRNPSTIARTIVGPSYTNPVYTCTKHAPAVSFSHASANVNTPPTPITGTDPRDARWM
jgi:hypothetical protein